MSNAHNMHVKRGHYISKAASIILACFACFIFCLAHSQSTFSPTNWKALEFSSTPAYKQAATLVLLSEANKLATALHLPETLPIVKSNLIRITVTPPLESDKTGTFGSIHTSSYMYSAISDNKLCNITALYEKADGQNKNLDMLKRDWVLPKAQMDTNAAYQQAIIWLKAACVDTIALEQDSQVEILAWDLEDKFVPLYWIRWYQKPMPFEETSQEQTLVAFVEMFLPSNSLRSLSIHKSKYINRRALEVSDREQYMEQSDDPFVSKAWFTTPVYKQAALGAMLNEVNKVITDLNLPEQHPIKSNDLTLVRIQTPFIKGSRGLFGTIGTSNYIFGAFADNKLSWLRKNLIEDDEANYLNHLESRYSANHIQEKTNSAYHMACDWLEKWRVNVKALNSDCKVNIKAWHSGTKIIPLYAVRWLGPNDKIIAQVDLVEPEAHLDQLLVTDAKYIQRPSLVVPGPKVPPPPH